MRGNIVREWNDLHGSKIFIVKNWSNSVKKMAIKYSGDENSNAGQENDDLDQVDAAEADAMGMMDTGDLDAEMAAADMGGNDY